MRFFTREWHSGELPDDEADAVGVAYHAHIQSLSEALPPGVRELATTLNLHDALVRRVLLDGNRRELRLELRCGDQQRGYEDVALTYHGTVLTQQSLHDLRGATERGGEVLYDEVDVIGDGLFSHQLLLWPLTLHFDAQIDTALFSARQEGRVVLESLRDVLDTPSHPIIRTREWWPHLGPPLRRSWGVGSVLQFLFQALFALARGVMGVLGCFCIYWGIAGLFRAGRFGAWLQTPFLALMATVGCMMVYVAYAGEPRAELWRYQSRAD